MKDLDELYNKLVKTPSDINEHLPILKAYADNCDVITEMGVRSAVSTVALLKGRPYKLVSYDIVQCRIDHLSKMVEGEIEFIFRIADSLKVDIDPTDMLFIDTLHNYTQLSQELKKHESKVKNWILLHDTTSFGKYGESYSGQKEEGIWKAVEEFLHENRNWVLEKRYTNNNGLTILRRK